MELQSLLQDASIRGDMSDLHNLLKKYPLALHRYYVGDLIYTPLHVAAYHGHVAFVQELLAHFPGLASILDSRRWSPLHLAASRGHTEVARALIKSSGTEMCEMMDGDGMNPVHLAVVKGGINVLRVLVEAEPHAACALTGSSENILYLCVKHNRPDCLELLLDKLCDFELVNVKNVDGNNVLHHAVKHKQIQMIKCIITQKVQIIDINATNAMGFTPLDILLKQKNKTMDNKYFEIKNILQEAGARKGYTNWLPRRRDTLMVVASLIATMAFAGGLNPPGGVWQENTNPTKNNPYEIPHRAGEAIFASDPSGLYKWYIRLNTMAFVSSLSLILLLISGLPFKRYKFMWMLRVVMWIPIPAMACTYAFAVLAMTPIHDRWLLKQMLVVATAIVWCIIFGLVLLGNPVRFIVEWIKGKSMDCFKAISRNNDQIGVIDHQIDLIA